MTKQSLKDKTAKGLFWGGVSNGIQQLLNLLFGIFLARLLTPADYGMVGMLTIFSLIATSIQDSGFTSALANKKEIKHEDYNAVFWFSIITSCCFYTILYFLAPSIARFFNQPELTSLARYSFLGFVISSTGIAQNAYMFRNLMVKQKALSTIIGLILSGIIGIILAYNGYSYWGIATQNITYITTVMVCYWIFSPWRPSFRINLTPLRDMLPFSSKMLATNIFNHLNNNLFSIILGKYYSEKEVGYYNQANKWNYMGHSLINGMLNGIAQPVLAQVSNERDRQLRVFRKMVQFSAFLSFPAMFGLSLIAPELITITITSKWIASAHILQFLCIGGAFIPIINLYSNLIISKGKSNIYMWNTITLGIIQLIIVSLTHSYGLYTMIICYLCINIIWILIWHYFIYKEITYKLSSLLCDVMPFLCIAAISTVASHYLTNTISNIYLLFICKIVVTCVLYISIIWLSGSQTFKECISYIKRNQL